METPTPKEQTPNVPRVPWNPWVGVLFVLILFYVAQLVASLLVLLYPYARHWSGDKSIDWLNSSTIGQFVYILLAETLTIGAVYLFLKRRGLKMSLIGFKKPRWKDVAWGVSAVPFYIVLYLLTVGVVSSLVHGLDVNQSQDIGFTNVHGAGQLILTYISLAVLPPITEEIVVRGFLYSSLKKALPMVWAVIGTSALFAAAHLPEGGAAGPLYIAALDTFVLSLVLIYLREKTGSLWASITLHAIKNTIAFVALFVFHAS